MEVRSRDDKLINDVINLRKRYSLVDKLSARSFNIFSILKTERNERFTHSAFIAELLNPKGSHYQGDIFLKLFLKALPDFFENISKDLLKTKVEVERYTGDGFIDIWLDFGDSLLCIENKIEAKDQKNQLWRYNEHCITTKKPYKILYLTLDGHESDSAKEEPNLDYTKWSYSEQIIPWLDLCVKETARLPVLRETIHQYLQLVKKLCGILQNENEAMELNDLLKKDFEHFEAANNIHEQFKRTKFDIKYDFWGIINSYYSEKYGDRFLVEFYFTEGDSYPKIVIGHRELEHWYVCFCIEWLQRNPYYGIYCYSFGDMDVQQKKIIKEFQNLNLSGYRSSDWWYSYRYYNNIDFSSIETLSQIFDSTGKQNLIQQITKPVDELIDQYENIILAVNNQIRRKFQEI